MPLSRSIHIYFWLAYILIFALNSTFFPTSTDSHFSMGWRIIRSILYHSVRVLPVLLLAYTFVLKILPDYIQKRKYRQGLLYTIPAILLAILLSRILLGYVIYPFLYHEIPDFPIFSPRRLFYSFIDLLSNSMIFIAFYVIVYQLQQGREEERLKNVQLEMELKFLQAQVNPHFLFNTLNNLYAMARKNSEHTASSIAKLSQIFRFILYKSGKKEILLEEELDLIQDYIELEKLRYDDRLNLDYQEDIDDHRQVIGPLLLLPLVENAFKHGAGETVDQIHINIALALNHKSFHFKIDNSMESPSAPREPGIGLKNLRRQLQLQYPNRHQLEIKQDEGFHRVVLKIDFI